LSLDAVGVGDGDGVHQRTGERLITGGHPPAKFMAAVA